MNRNVIRFSCRIGRMACALLVVAMLLPAYAMADDVKVTLSLKDATLPVILKEIKQQTGYDCMYNAQEIDTEKKISVGLDNVALDSALHVCLRPFGLTYTMKGKIIVLQKIKQLHLSHKYQAFAQSGKNSIPDYHFPYKDKKLQISVLVFPLQM